MLTTLAMASALLTAALLGSMVFFAAVATPAVFAVLPAEHGGNYLRALFPRYYLWGLILAVLAAITAAPVSAASALALGAVALAFLAVRSGLLPIVNRLRDAARADDLAAAARFRRMHTMSVAVNLTQMVVLGIVFVQLWGRG